MLFLYALDEMIYPIPFVKYSHILHLVIQDENMSILTKNKQSKKKLASYLAGANLLGARAS
jgi:hypothetical protein